MRFPCVFSRYKGASRPAGSVLLGGDAFPAGKPATTNDNVLFARAYSKNGLPTKRVILAGAYFAAVANPPPALNVSAYVWDDGMGFWILCTGSASAITPGDTTAATPVPGVPLYFDIPVLTDAAPTLGNIQAGTDPGTIAVLFLISDNAASDGEYRFTAAPVLNEKAE